MKRRRFLCQAIKSASAAVCSQILSPGFGASLFPQSATPKTPSSPSARPQLAFTLDDPTLSLGSVLKWQEANSRILSAISEKGVRAALFVCGMRVDEADGTNLLTAWDKAGHLICNHSYSHKFYGEQTSYADFAVDFLKNEKVIAPYHNRTALFRYPFLKEGDTTDKRDRFRALLKQRGYRVGHVTIDASDWYVSQRFVDRLGKQPKVPIAPYRDYLVAHLLDRAAFYRQLALDVLGRDIRHTLLMHFNPLNAFVLPHVMTAFEAAGWQWIDASSPLKTPFSAASRRLFPPEKAWSGPSPRRQGDLRIVCGTPGRMTFTKSLKWTPSGYSQLSSVYPDDPLAKLKILKSHEPRSFPFSFVCAIPFNTMNLRILWRYGTSISFLMCPLPLRRI